MMTRAISSRMRFMMGESPNIVVYCTESGRELQCHPSNRSLHPMCGPRP